VVVRPSDWFLVGLPVDPTPGDAFGIRALASKYGEIAQIAGDASTGVRHARSSGAASAWVGDAGDVFRDKSERMPGELAKANESYDLVAEALRVWAAAVDDTQAQADRGLQQAREAHHDLSAAQAALAGAEWSWTTAHAQQLTYQTLKKAYSIVPPPPGVKLPTDYQLRSVDRSAQQAQASIASAKHAIADADARLAAARALVLAAKERRDDAERAALHQIAEAGDHAVKPSSVWEAIQDSAAWQAIVTIATVVLTVLTIVFLIVGGPLVWALIIAATVLLIVDALMSIAQGKDAWGELALLAVGLIPGGRVVELAGTAFRSASAAVSGLNLASRLTPAAERVSGLIGRIALVLKSDTGDIAAGASGLHTVETAIEDGAQAIPEGFDQVVSMFGMKTANAIVGSAAPTIGQAGHVAWLSPAQDILANVHSPMDAMIQSGAAPSVTQAFMNNEPIFALFARNNGLALRLPDYATEGATANFLPGGFTANIVGGEAIVNATREMVMDGGVAVSAGDEIRVFFQTGAEWAWKTWHVF